MSETPKEVTKSTVKDASTLDDGNTNGSTSEIPGENKDETTTKILGENKYDTTIEISEENKDDTTIEIKKSTNNANIMVNQIPVQNPMIPVPRIPTFGNHHIFPSDLFMYPHGQSMVPFPGSVNECEPFTIEEIDDSVYLNIIDKNLLAILQQFVRSEELYAVKPKVMIGKKFRIKLLTDYVGNNLTTNNVSGSNVPLDNPHILPLKNLVNWLEKAFDTTLKQIDNMINKQEISFKHLWYLFPTATQVYAQLHNKIVGARVTNCEYKTYFGTQFFTITGEIIESNGHEFVNCVKYWHIDHFLGVLSIDKLPAVPLKKECEIRDKLVKRGKIFEKYALGAHYLRYSGRFFRKSWVGDTYYRGDGRIMIDAATFSQIDPNYKSDVNNNRHNYIHNSSIKGDKKKVKEEELYMCAPTFFGFSFIAKKWGQFYVDQVDEIKFDDDAFNNLIMDTNKKDIIASLVTSEPYEGLDLISGKGGGCIFLLHGPPGAISEYLHRPLYAVSVGELGVTPKELEAKLSEILEVASIWNAVILIDEVDIFLEQRSKNDVNRNALVGIFLRLLEYHQGILFLTTNRVESFDMAFHSRISIVLKYNVLDETSRAQIWRTFLDRADGKNKSQVDIEKLKQRQLNGREIKTAVRMAKALATRSNPPNPPNPNAIITTSLLEKILDISDISLKEI
ncbi:7695_t:CDS:10 [Cetraspora pellucida]|uniref:7695_t:CDS:1 n=1 Tax=Cetraspora pellucida TaxID=1433469 RepID=A0A9N9A744_9GLOM|nr:7695_t:CDS:10 [Cetraspora pellucida]